jgi:hypothetical protein
MRYGIEAEQVAYLRQRRANTAPFDVAIDGISQPDDGARVRDYEAAGATWWFEALFGLCGSVGEMLKRVEAGPPG